MFSILCQNDLNDLQGIFSYDIFLMMTRTPHTHVVETFSIQHCAPNFLSRCMNKKKHGNKIKVNEMKEENVNLTQHKSHWHVTHPQTQRPQFFLPSKASILIFMFNLGNKIKS